MKKLISSIVFILCILSFQASFAQNNDSIKTNNKDKDKDNKKSNKPDLINWSEEKIKLWEDSVKQALFPQPVIDSVQINDQHQPTSNASKISTMAKVSSSNSYVPDIVNIDQSKAVGEITINQSITPSGATTYTVPVEISPGAGGLQPQIGMGYNSQGGNSVMGMGWNIGGLSSITRVCRNQHYDGVTQGITMNTSDAFVLDGLRLIKISENASQIRYESEQGNIKAVAYISGTLVKYFEVFYPNGNKGVFGDINNSLSKLSYPLTVLTDLKGNSVNYSYNFINNKYYITNIAYVGGSVEFQYQTGRTDLVVNYQGGLKVTDDRLLSSVICRYTSNVIRTYSFEYITQKRTSLLNKINCSAGGSSFNPLIFYYGENNVASSFSKGQTQLIEWYAFTTPGQVILEKGKFDYGSEDDGLIVLPYNESYWNHQRSATLFRHSQNQFQNLYSGTEKIFLYTGLNQSYALPMPNLFTEPNFIKIFCANTDGKDEEEVIKVNNGIVGSYDQIIFNVYNASLYTGLAKKYTRTFNFSTVLTDQDGKQSIHPKFYFPGDFNGDGKMEVLAVSNHNPIGSTVTTKCYLFDLETNTKLFEGYTFPYIVEFYGTNQTDPTAAFQNTDRLYALDYNGDGKTDICLINDQGIKIYTFNISGSSYSLSLVSTYTGLKKADLNGKILMVGEFNGDDKPDFLLSPVTQASDWNILYSMGNGQFEKSTFSMYRFSFDSYQLQDVNSDGLTDLITTSSAGFQTYLAVSGNGFQLEAANTYDNTNSLIIPTNINSRNYFHQLVAIKDGIATRYSFPRNDNKERLLTGAVNSLGLITKSYYAQLNEGAQYTYLPMYTKGYGAVYPYENFQGALIVTGKTELYHNGQLAGSSSTSYSNAVIHKQGLGFAGFESIVTTDLLRDRSSVQTFNPYNYGIKISDDSPTVANSYNYSVNVQTNKQVKILLNSVNSSDKLKGNTTNTTYLYDSYGNPTWESIDYGAGIVAYTYFTYYNNTNDAGYLLGFPTNKRFIINRNGTYWESSTDIPEYSNGLPKKVVNYVNSSTVSTETYSYDSMWNLTSKTLKNYNSSTNFSTSYLYDSYGRVIKETDPMGFSSYYTYDSGNGNLSTTKNNKLQATTFSYDSFGRVTAKAYPDGTSEATTMSWEASYTGGTNARYGVQVTATGKPTSKKYYDALNRETRNSVTRFDGQIINTDLLYDTYGRLEKTSLPYRTNIAGWNTNYYDSNDRLSSIAAASGKTTSYSYSDNSVTTVADGISKTKTYDTQGNMVSVTDPAGTITYNLRPDGQPGSVVSPGGVTTNFSYDTYGRQLSITDPSAGTQSHTYDGQGNISTQTDANNKTISYTYDTYNRTLTKSTPEFTTSYTYNTDGLLSSEISTNGTKSEMTYDSFGRINTVKETVPDGKYLQKGYTYTTGNVAAVQYTTQSGVIATENFSYANGYNTEIKLNNTTSIWKLTGENALGQPTASVTGNLYRTYSYTAYGTPTGRTAGIIQNFSYNFDELTGNLLSRTDNNRTLTENFGYDNLNRLSTIDGQQLTYADNGNITAMPGTGTLQYGNTARPYQVTMLTPTGNAVPLREQTLTYTSFQRPATITENGYTAAFTYNAAGDRVKMALTLNGTATLTRYYISGQYEADTETATERLYLGGDAYSAPAVYVKEAGLWKIYYICRDYLGSITHIANADGTLKAEYSYDAWGRLRNPVTQVAYAPGTEPALFLGRGYTSHEHLPWFGLINMNARLYDPALGRFLSPDPYVQAPDFSQSFNRYSYCLNNPLRYVDQSGEIAVGDDWVVGFIKGFVRSIFGKHESGHHTWFGDAWASANRHAGNSAKIWGGLFTADTSQRGWGKQILSRWTWQLPQTVVGFIGAHGTNMIGHVNKVEYGYGATVLQKTGDWGAITLGSYIIGDKSIEADPNNDLFQHEYGHYLQSQSSGPLYLFHYGIPSGYDSLVNDYWGHTKHWSEQDANRRGLNFFSKDSNYKGWRFYWNPIYDSIGNKIYKLSDDKGSFNNPKWWEYALFFSALSIIL